MFTIPFLLIYLRIAITFVIIFLGLWQPDHSKALIVVLTAVGLLSDLLDGVIARKQGISTEKLRTMDSNVDQFFWLSVLVVTFRSDLIFVTQHWIWIGLVVFLEALCYMISLLKFRRTVATHSLLAKIWTATLLLMVFERLIFPESSIAFFACIILGIISRIEIIAILLILKVWATDVKNLKAARSMNSNLAEKQG